MRRLLPLALLALTAACGRADEALNNTVDQALPNVMEAPPATNGVTMTDPGLNEVATADKADLVPVALQGRWTGTADDCANAAAELELKVTPNQLLFHESVGTIRAVKPQADGRIAVDADFTGEGESWTRRLMLHPSADGARLTVANDGTSVVRKRCDAAA